MREARGGPGLPCGAGRAGRNPRCECTGPGADRSGRVEWSRELTRDERADYLPWELVFAKKTGSEQFRGDWEPLANLYLRPLLGCWLSYIRYATLRSTDFVN